MKKLLLMALISGFSVTSAFAAGGKQSIVSCFSNLTPQGFGYTVNIFDDKGDADLAVLGKYLPGETSRPIETYPVTKTPPGDPGAPLVYSTPSGNFLLNICATCTPVDGKVPATLNAITNDTNLQGLPMLCTIQ